VLKLLIYRGGGSRTVSKSKASAYLLKLNPILGTRTNYEMHGPWHIQSMF